MDAADMDLRVKNVGCKEEIYRVSNAREGNITTYLRLVFARRRFLLN